MKGFSLYEQLHFIIHEEIEKSPKIWRPNNIQDVIEGLDQAHDFLQNYLLITGDQDYLPRTRDKLQEAIEQYIETGSIAQASGLTRSVDPNAEVLQSPAKLLFNATYRGTEAAQDDFYRIQLEGNGDLMLIQTNLRKSLSDIGKGVYAVIYHIGYGIADDNRDQVAQRAQELFNYRISA